MNLSSAKQLFILSSATLTFQAHAPSQEKQEITNFFHELLIHVFFFVSPIAFPVFFLKGGM